MATRPEDFGDGFAMVITSPPYPNAYEYWLYHKYRMYWLGMDPIAVRAREIGARPHYFRQNPATETDFEKQMEHCFAMFRSVLQESGIVCLLVGRSIIHGRYIDNAALVRGVAKRAGFSFVAEFQRHVRNDRRSFNPSLNPRLSECVLVFRNGP